MSMAYIKLFYDWIEATDQLDYTEKGRLIEAMLVYARDGCVPELPGNERFVFPGFKNQLDRDRESYARAGARREENARAREEKAKKKEKVKEEEQDQDQDQDGYRESNGHWRTSVLARKGEAQLLVDHCIREKLPCAGAKNLYDVVLHAMESGLEPGEIFDCARESEAGALGLKIYEALCARGLKPA